MAYSTVVARHRTREVNVGGTVVGGDNPIWVQSMTTTNTFDAAETIAQIRRLEEAGCELVRVTVPKKLTKAEREALERSAGILKEAANALGV